MIVLQVNKLSKYYGAERILSNIKLEVQKRDRIGLVGRNGAGKSTLLKIIADQLSHDEGEIIKAKDLTIGYLAQNTDLQSQRSIWDEMLTVFTPLIELEKQLRRLEQKMTLPETYNNEELYQKVLREYDELQINFKEKGGYQYEADIRSVLHGLQFQQFSYDTPISTLSGGQRTRLALGKLLLAQPELLILDEPTNHLDIETLTWLEQYLAAYKGAVLIVSHDRYFMDKVITIVYELSRTSIKKYYGNYSHYLERKAEDYERDMKQFEKQQDEIAKLNDFIQKNIVRASTTKRAQSRRKQLEKMTVMDKPLGDEKSASFTFRMDKQSGHIVSTISDVSIGFKENEPIAQNINIPITKGDSIALVGPNGVGKTTLLKSVIGRLKVLKGQISFGSNVVIGYYDQEQANLSSNKTVLNELWDEYPQTNEKDIRTVLGNFLFSGDDVLKPVSTLSGGEKARLALAKLILLGANFLILDEPTNHLDLDSKIVLENALVEFPGTILFVSHDRYFINRIASKVVEMSPLVSEEFLGDYDYYLQKKEERKELQLLENQSKPATAMQTEKKSFHADKEEKKKQRQIQRRLTEIENRIEELEVEIEQQNTLLCDPDIYQDHEKVLQINEKIENCNQELEQLMDEWAELED